MDYETEPQFEPMSISRILDRIFYLYKENFIRFIAIIAAVQVPLTLVSILFQTGMRFAGTDESGGGTVATIIGVVLIGSLITWLGHAIGSAALAKNISEAYLGREATVGESYRSVLPVFGTLIGASLLIMLVTWIGFILFIVPGVIFSFWLVLTVPIIVVERTKAVAAMKRSRYLVRGNIGKIFVVLLVVMIIQMTAGVICGGLAQGIVSVSGLSPAFQQVASALAELAGTVLTAPLTAGATILLYYDMRIRKEGFDLEMLAAAMEGKNHDADMSAGYQDIGKGDTPPKF